MEYFLTTKRCGFSHWKIEDLELAITLWGQPEVTKYICASGEFTMEQIESRLHTEINNLKNYGVQYFPFYTLEGDKFVGCCGLRPYKNEVGVYEIGFHLLKEYWCQGYAFEVATKMINYAFSTLDVKELKAGHNPNNIASKKVLSKLGFQYEMDEFYEPTGLYHPLYKLLR